MGVSHGCSTIFMQYQNGRGGIVVGNVYWRSGIL